MTGRPCYCYSSNYRCRPYHGYLTIAEHMTRMLMTKSMKPPLLLLPSCNYDADDDDDEEDFIAADDTATVAVVGIVKMYI